MPIYMEIPKILKKYEGSILTKDLIKKIIDECTPKYIDVDEYYRD